MRQAKRECGFLLLEVVVAVGLLVLGMAVIGAQIQTSAVRARETDQSARVTFLAESKFAEIDTGLITPDEDEIEKDFGRLFPAYAWRLRFQPTGDLATGSADNFDNLGLAFIRLEILYDPRRDPDEEFDFDGAEVLETYYTLRAAPRPLDLTADFGMEDDVADKLNEDLAGLGGGDIDVRNFNHGFFRDKSTEEILEMAPALMEAFGMEESELLSLVPEDMRATLEAVFEAQKSEDDQSGEGDGGTGADGGGDGGEGGDEATGGDDGANPDDVGTSGVPSGGGRGASGAEGAGSTGGRDRRPAAGGDRRTGGGTGGGRGGGTR